MIRHVTRFTEEIFALIIAVVYLYEPFKKLYKVKIDDIYIFFLSSHIYCFSKIFQLNPVRSKYTYDYPLTCLCNLSSSLTSGNAFSSSSAMNYSCYNCISPRNYTSSETNHTLISNDENPLPNKALLSFIILLGTCFISVALKQFRRSNFFGRTVRSF
jgi:hypothetical protein